MFFDKKDLLNEHYTWVNAASEPTYTGEPSRRLFDRYNGNQVLLIINSLCERMGKLTISDGRRLEELISTQLPVEAKSELSVFNWLKTRY